MVRSALPLCADGQFADCMSLHCKVSFCKQSHLRVTLTCEVALYLLGAVFIDSEKCTSTVIVPASLFLFANALFLVSSLAFLAFGIPDGVSLCTLVRFISSFSPND